ncbi:MAG: haloacid dehalogenase-like hydrolase [bacterium]|nr:haloacid dehalogenase-like hydrolase [bacterium]
MTTKPIAVFDLDGTFVRSSLLIQLVRGLVHHGVFPTLAEQEIEEQYRAWRDRRGSYQDYLLKVVEVFYRRIRGCSAQAVEQVGILVANEQHNQVYVYTRRRIEELRASHHLVAITGSPDVVAKPFTESWGFARVYPSTLVVEGGEYNGDRFPRAAITSNISELKRGLLEQALAECDATLEGSIGFGDTESDVSVLERMETAIAFNPNLDLARAAAERGWKMVCERKNTIVHLSNGRYFIEGIAEPT